MEKITGYASNQTLWYFTNQSTNLQDVPSSHFMEIVLLLAKQTI